METLTANLASTGRTEILQGREFFVRPVTLIVPGVLNGSKGPLLYPPEDVARSRDAWNGVPITLDHPGESARQPAILESVGMGTIFNAATGPGGELTGEAWIDVANAKRISPAFLAALRAGRKIEVSTGLGTANELAPEGATFNGQAYTHIARNYQPDHLAVLLGAVGACSIEDGCGIRNALVDNAMAFADISGQLAAQLREKFGQETYVEAVYDKAVVYARGEKFYRLAYAVDRKTETVSLGDEAASEVRREVAYKPVRNTEGDAMDKTKIVDFLIKNDCCLEEGDRETLNGLPEPTLAKMKDSVEKAQAHEAVANAARKGFTDPGGNTHTWNEEKQAWESKEKPAGDQKPEGDTTNRASKPLTKDEWLAQAPEEIRTGFARAERIENDCRKKAVATITANKQNKLTAEQLAAMDTDTLESLAASVAPPDAKALNFTGAAAGVANVKPDLPDLSFPGEVPASK